jgi:hypothetical protein
MTPMPRKNKLELSVAREPSGRRARARNASDPAPAQVKRLRDAALAGLQSQEWGSELGRLFLAGKIAPELYAAGRRWVECMSRYHAALGAPPPCPPPIPFERSTTTAAPDPASEPGLRQAAREIEAVRELREAQAAMRQAGVLAERVVRSVCEQDLAPCGTRELDALGRGLLALAQFWRMARRTR